MEKVEFRKDINEGLKTEISQQIKNEAEDLFNPADKPPSPFAEYFTSGFNQPGPSSRSDFFGWAETHFNFAELGHTHFYSPDSRISLTLKNGKPKADTQWSGNNEVAGEATRLKTSSSIWRFKNFILKNYGPSAVTVMWARTRTSPSFCSRVGVFCAAMSNGSSPRPPSSPPELISWQAVGQMVFRPPPPRITIGKTSIPKRPFSTQKTLPGPMIWKGSSTGGQNPAPSPMLRRDQESERRHAAEKMRKQGGRPRLHECPGKEGHFRCNP